MEQKQRQPFSEKFSHVAPQFQIDSDKLQKFLVGYEEKYHKALQEIKEGTFTTNLMDHRSTAEYLYDLCEGWLMEDLISFQIKELSKGLFSVKLNGCEVSDKGRNVRTAKISAKSDLVIKGPGRTQKLEIQFNNKLRKFYDIKETKIRQAQKEQSLIFVYSLPQGSGFLLDPLSPMHLQSGQLRSNPGWGGKMAYRFAQESINSLGGFMPLSELVRLIHERVK